MPEDDELNETRKQVASGLAALEGLFAAAPEGGGPSAWSVREVIDTIGTMDGLTRGEREEVADVLKEAERVASAPAGGPGAEYFVHRRRAIRGKLEALHDSLVKSTWS